MVMNQKQTHSHREQRLVLDKGWEGRIGSLGFSEYKLVYIGWINNQVLLLPSA